MKYKAKKNKAKLVWLKMAVVVAASSWVVPRAQAPPPSCTLTSRPHDFPPLSAHDFKITFALLPVLGGEILKSGKPGVQIPVFPF